MLKIKVILITISAFFLSLTAMSQYAEYETEADSSGYFPAFWKKASDSLAKEWIATKISPATIFRVNIPEKKKAEKIINKYFPEAGLVYRQRTGEILEVYYRSQNAAYSAAMFDIYKKQLTESLELEGIPPSLAYTAFALSAMQNKIRNHTGGAGYWQIGYSFGVKFGLLIDSYVDERRDVVKSSVAAAKTLKALYDIYGDWKLTLAAYTCGPANVNKAIRRNGNRTDFYVIYPSLPYFGRDVVDALAASFLFFDSFKNNYDFNYDMQVDTIEVSKRLHFIQLSDILHLNIDEIRFLNPIYKFDIVPAVNEVFLVLLPKGNLDSFNLYEDSIYTYKDSILFNLHKKVILPPPPKGRHWATPVKAEIPENSVAVYYHIKSGDNLGYVASWFDVSVSKIEDWNNIYNPRRIQIGRKLKIYVPKNKAAYYKKIDNMSFAQKQKLVGKTLETGKTAAGADNKKEEPLTSGFFWYTVKNGESPYLIAKKFPGVSADDILRWNNIKDPRKIHPGQKLKIKKVK